MEVKKIEEMSASEISFGKLVSIISRSQVTYLNRGLADLNIRGFQIPLLIEIYKSKELSQNDLASRFKIDKGAVSRALSKLEENGFISRKIDKDNKRRNIVSLTEKGEETICIIIDIFKKWEDEIWEDIDLIEKEVLHEVLKIIALKAIELNEKEE